MKAILLAGGEGRRLLPYTTVLPKPLMPLGDMPVLEIIIRQLKSFGFTDIVISVGHLANLIQAFFGSGARWGVNISYSIENEPLGTAGPLKLIENPDDNTLFMNGDILTDLNYLDLINFHREQKALFTVAAYERDSKIDFGVLEKNDTDIIDYIEKPVYHFDVSMGIYCVNARALDYIEANEKINVPDLILKLINNSEPVKSYKADCMWLDIGRLDDYESAVDLFEKNRNLFLKEDNH